MHSERPRFVDHHPLAAAQDRSAYVFAGRPNQIAAVFPDHRKPMTSADPDQALLIH